MCLLYCPHCHAVSIYVKCTVFLCFRHNDVTLRTVVPAPVTAPPGDGLMGRWADGLTLTALTDTKEDMVRRKESIDNVMIVRLLSMCKYCLHYNYVHCMKYNNVYCRYFPNYHLI